MGPIDSVNVRACRPYARSLLRHSVITQRLCFGLVLFAGIFAHGNAAAQEQFAPSAFSTCPSKAFLTQGTVPKTYAINLVTGQYSAVSSDHGVSRPLNAVGFNSNDRYFYGWSYEHGQPARVHNDWEVEPLAGVNITNQNFYVGDVNAEDNSYYVYRRGANYGLYAIGLDPNRVDYLQMSKVVDGVSLSLYIADMAFHPSSGLAYAVEFDGDVYEIDVRTGDSNLLGNSGQKGTFGAAYFDVEGNLYIGRNNDGSIFRLKIDSGSYAAELFASGPPASTNDGSRCASAPIIDDTDIAIDFGDAPDSYGSSLANNGARHGLSMNPNLFLGFSVDGESDSSFFPLSDEGQGDTKDEDGVQFITPIVGRESAIANVRASQAGFLSVWIDIERDGRFDAVDQVLSDFAIDAGEQGVYLPIPAGVVSGESWARFRLTSTLGAEATGGVSDGEVEDYAVTISANPVTITTYPSPTEWATVSFEDNWPFAGDYDMNDLVFYLRTVKHETSSGIEKIEINGELAAVGAEYHNGFAIRLPGVLRNQIDESALEFRINNKLITDFSPLEADTSESIFIIEDDMFDYVGPGEHCNFYRTESGCGSAIEFEFSLSIEFLSPVTQNLTGVFDPFLFATPGQWHGPHFNSPPGRSYEVHLKNQAPTEKFNQALFSAIGDDRSSPDDGLYFLTDAGLPWALEVSNRWDYPLEYVDITSAYPQFSPFATSGGTTNKTWFMLNNAIDTLVFKD